MFFCLKPAKRRMFHEYFFNGDTFYNFFINSYNCVTDTWDFKEMLNKFPNISKELLDICMYMLEYIHELGFINMNFKLLINLDYNFLDSIDIYDKEILKRYLTFRYLKRQNFIYSKIQQ